MDKLKFTDGQTDRQTQATSIPVRPERSLGNKSDDKFMPKYPGLPRSVYMQMVKIVKQSGP